MEERDACSSYSQEAESGVMSPDWSVSRCHQKYWSLHPCAAGKGSQDRVTPGQMGAVIRAETRENWAKEVRFPLVAAGGIAPKESAAEVHSPTGHSGVSGSS